MITTVSFEVYFLIPLVLLMIIKAAQGLTSEHVQRLQNDCLFNYNRNIRPIEDQFKPITVGFQLELMSIVGFDEVKGEITVSAALILHWLDTFIKWNPTNYSGIYMTLFEYNQVWIPSLIILNSVSEIHEIGGKPWQQVRVFATGDAYYTATVLFSASCTADVTYNPFDRHNCFLLFAPSSYIPQEMVFKVELEEKLLQYYYRGASWTLKETNITVIRNETAFINGVLVALAIERQSRFIMFNVVIPIISMGFLNLIIFFIPADSGEKISYSITMLLSIAVFLTLVNDNLPKVSDPMAVSSFYLLGVLIMSILIIWATVFNLRLFKRDDEIDPVEGFWLKIGCFWKCKCRSRCKRRRVFKTSDRIFSGSVVTASGSDMSTRSREDNSSENQFIGFHQSHSLSEKEREQTRQYLEKRETDANCAEKIKQNESKPKWKDVSDAMDKLFFVLFSIILLTGTVCFVIILTG